MNKNYIYQARRLAGITQKQVADLLEIKQSTYSSKEQRLHFTKTELKKIENLIGSDIIKEVQDDNASLELNDAPATYGKAGDEYRELLKKVNELSELQKAGLMIQAELFAGAQNRSVKSVIDDINKLIKKKTGKDTYIL